MFKGIKANVVNIGSSVVGVGANAFIDATIGKVNIASSKTTVEGNAFPGGTVINYAN